MLGAGYLIGSSSAPSVEDAGKQRASAFVSARKDAMDVAYRRSAAQGRHSGIRAGRRSARRSGEAKGGNAGEGGANAELAAIADSEAQAEAEERAENCGAPLFVDGYCPTDAEIEQEGLAESLCGPGDEAHAIEAAEQGIQCRPTIP
jgi:hypothetical protein